MPRPAGRRRRPGVDRAGRRRREQRHRRLDRAVDAVHAHQVAHRGDLRDERRHRGHLDAGARRADRHGEEDQPHRVVAGHHDERERQRRHRDRGIRPHDQVLAVVPVGPHAAEDRDDRLGEEAEQRGEHHHDAGLVGDREVPEHRVLHEHRAEQAHRLPAQEQDDLPQPVRRVGGFRVRGIDGRGDGCRRRHVGSRRGRRHRSSVRQSSSAGHRVSGSSANLVQQRARAALERGDPRRRVVGGVSPRTSR